MFKGVLIGIGIFIVSLILVWWLVLPKGAVMFSEDIYRRVGMLTIGVGVGLLASGSGVLLYGYFLGRYLKTMIQQ